MKTKRTKKQDSDPRLWIRLFQGFHDRHSLPLDYVVRTLKEIQGMLQIAGKRVEREQGTEKPTGDVGLELVAGFSTGSVMAQLRSTRKTDVFIEAAEEVVQTIQFLGDSPRATPVGSPPVDIDPRIIRRLNNIGKIQEINKTRMELVLKRGPEKSAALFDENAARRAASWKDPNFSIDEITLFGKLRALRSKTEADDDDDFSGELVSDDGQSWRLKFRTQDEERAASLFAKQVYVIGKVNYYRAVAPRIAVQEFGRDEDRDYEAAFDELYGSKKDLYKADLESLLNELRGES